MTIFGVLWLIIIISCFFRKSIKFLLFITLFSMILQSTNVISYNGIMIGPQVITCFSFILRCILIKKDRSIIRINKIKIGLFLVFLSVILSSIINDSLVLNLLKIIQLAIYMITFLCIANISDKIDKDFIELFIKKTTIFILILGVIQILSSGNIIPRISIINNLFFNDTSLDVYYWHENYLRITSTFMEPSYCGSFLVASFFYFISIYKKNKKNVILLISIFLEIILTQSTTAYASLVICGILFIIFSKNRQIKRIILPISIFVIFILFLFAYNLLDTVIFSKASSGSALTRGYWNKNAIKAFQTSRLFGIGYKNLRGSSIIYSLLGEIGIFGLISYLFFNLEICKQLLKKIELGSIGIRFSILSIIICQFISCPDLDLCVYWMFLYLAALSGIYLSNKKKEHK